MFHPKSQAIKKIHLVTLALYHSEQQPPEALRQILGKPNLSLASTEHTAGISGRGKAGALLASGNTAAGKLVSLIAAISQKSPRTHGKTPPTAVLLQLRQSGAAREAVRALLASAPHDINYLRLSGASAGNLRNISAVNIC